jgi:predicted AAA+ superfamily ATPase
MENSYAIPTEKILERLRFENPWWRTGAIAAQFNDMNRRLYFDLFFPMVQDITVRRALILMGPRRVGKTVMMHHAIHALLESGVPASSIAFIGIDNPIYINMGLEELFLKTLEASGSGEAEGNYVFFDEIQYLRDWERHLKVMVDSYPKTKFIVSGSAAAALRMKSSESGAGRFHDFMLPPLTFQEFIHLQDLQYLVQPNETTFLGTTVPFYKAIDIKELNQQFFNYLNYGGYPEVLFDERIKDDMPKFIKNDIIDKVLLRDLPSIYGISDVQELNRFFTYLAFNTGKEFSYQKIAKDSALKKEKIREYLQYLEAVFLISVVNKVDVNARHFKRVTGFKVYLTNPSLRTALFSPVSYTDDEAGGIVETAIFSQWMHRENVRLYYARWRLGRKEGEVDMVQLDDASQKPSWAVEIKWSNRFADNPGKLRSLIEFCKQNRIKAAVVTSIDRQTQLLQDGIELNYHPASLYAYIIGANTLNQSNEKPTF